AGEPAARAGLSLEEQFPWSFELNRTGLPAVCSTPGDVPDPAERETLRYYQAGSRVSLPLSIGGRIGGIVAFESARERRWPDGWVHTFELVGGIVAHALSRQQAHRSLQSSLSEIRRLRDRLHEENVTLRRAVRDRIGSRGVVVGQSAAVRHVMDQIGQVAMTDSTVLLLGETGTGKELFATQIHELSRRRSHAMVQVNCGAIPATLIESELFGREKGAFTGALTRQIGRFELANHSTIFLDEIGELPLDVQIKLLRVLEARKIERLGSSQPINVDVRIIAATHRQLEQKIAEGSFREDLFYRLNVFPIRVPPLRERSDDIPLLVNRFVEEFSQAFNKPIEELAPQNIETLQRYSWPGNIRELRNVVERAMIMTTSRRLTISVPSSSAAAQAKQTDNLKDLERAHILSVLESTGWRIRGTGGAAARLGLKPTTLETRLARLGLSRPK
ncbi:MAG TPA: sigma-54 dependent transcriptional regulator, partial [Vicinamibacterales bacterium]